VDQKLLPGLIVGVDTYYKVARDMIDDGQFGQAVVLTQFNWDRGYSEGAEFKAKYQNGNFKAYANFSYSIMRATDAVSNQYLLDPATYVYLLNNYHYADDMQLMSASAGASYRWDKTLVTTNMIYGSGLRSGFANMEHNPAYTTVSLGIAHEFTWSDAANAKPATVRFDIVNVFDQIYSSAMAPASASSPRNSACAAVSVPGCRRSSEKEYARCSTRGPSRTSIACNAHYTGACLSPFRHVARLSLDACRLRCSLSRQRLRLGKNPPRRPSFWGGPCRPPCQSLTALSCRAIFRRGRCLPPPISWFRL
jgi:hypothetical protein